MDSLDLIYDHYKETFSFIQEAQNKRNKYFVILCILETILFLFIVQPNAANEALVIMLKTSNEFVTWYPEVFQSLLWILILYTFIRYCQSHVYVDRQYHYLYKIEEFVSYKINNFTFCREGSNYKYKYPLFLKSVYIFYTWIAPLLFAIINLMKIIHEWFLWHSLIVVFDTFIFIILVLFIVVYLHNIHK